MNGTRRGAASRTTGQATVTARRDAGGASVLVVASAAVLLAATGATLAYAGVLSAGQRAAAAADLAALAAAGQMARGEEPCAAASRVAAAARAALESCRAGTDGSVQVQVRLDLTGTWSAALALPPARAQARAGPSASS